MKQTALLAIVVAASLAVAAADERRPVNGTIWAANRAAHTIRGFDAATGDVVKTIAMSAGSQPGDLAYAKGKIYVAEEFGTPPAVAIVDPELAPGTEVVHRITFPTLPATARPHHVHASQSGDLVAVGLYGTDMVAVIDTSDDTLLGPWDSNPATTNGRVHAAVFSNDGNVLYLANEGANELVAMDPRSGVPLWRLTIPSIHEIAVTHDGKTAYVSRRGAGQLALVNLEDHTYGDVLALPTPDTLELSADEKTLTVGLRTPPARTAVIDTTTMEYELVTLSVAGETTTTAGHQWTAPSGRYTFASFEGGAHPGIAVIDHKAGNQVVQRLDYPGRPHGVDYAVR